MLALRNNKLVPVNELQISFARSSGAGGQNVNKTSTKVFVHWSLGRSRVFSGEEKDRIRAKLSNRINNRGELVVSAEAERSQAQNRAIATAHLQALVNQALRVPKKRRPTRPTKASKTKRLASKKLHSRLKTARRGWFE
ncbi:MAG: alternative ribosome rescue aminoacyl-tRNA hydrolase ArfB [bacterium]|nr:alternative ribosome rescue aminoacyl-tRNA hydrolase ArfB [bacterium]